MMKALGFGWSRSGSVLLVALALALGCGGEEASEETEPVEVESEAPESAEETPEEEAPAAEAPEAPGAPGAPQLDQNAAAALEGLGAMLRAAETAEGATPCETAYNAGLAMTEVMRRRLPADQLPPDDQVPDRADFLARCNELPESTQLCMTLSYAMSHREECRTALEGAEAQALRDHMRNQANQAR